MILSSRFTPVRIACLAFVAALSACSSVDNFMSGEKIDYRSGGKTRTQSLEVPPDLSQLNRDSRYTQQGGSISASQFQSGNNTAAVSTIAPKELGAVKLVREGNQRWLSVPMSPEQVWPQLQGFWKDLGFNLMVDQAETGVMETDWVENRAKLPNDIIRNTLGRVIDSLYSTGTRDKFRTRVERVAGGCEIYVTHRGVEEVYSNEHKDATVWQPSAADPQLEAQMLQRILLRLGAKEDVAKSTVATPVTAPARARVVEGQSSATLTVDDSFDRAWRRVGLALDRSGFTVEDRDRTQGLYFVRYVDPAQAGKDEPGFFSRVFSFGKKDHAADPVKYRVQVKGQGDVSTVTVLNPQGQPEIGEAGQRIVKLLVEDLK